MTWAPREGSRVDKLLQAMRAEQTTRRVWTSDEAAKVMGVAKGAVAAYVAGACNAAVLFRRTVQDGLELSLQRFPLPDAAAPVTSTSETPQASMEVPRFIPPQMKAPRPGSEHPRVLAGSPRPAPLGTAPWPTRVPVTGPEAAAADAQVVARAPAASDLRHCATCQDRAACTAQQDCEEAKRFRELQLRPGDGIVGVTKVANPPVPAPISPQELPAASGEAHPENDETTGEPEEPAEFDYCTWRDGSVQIWGAAVAADGSFVLTQEQLEEIAAGGPRP